MSEPVIHIVKFERNTINGRWRALCSCFWSRVGTREEVQSAAAVHDREWIEANPDQPVSA